MKQVVIFLVFTVFGLALWAVSEVEPNSGVQLSLNEATQSGRTYPQIPFVDGFTPEESIFTSISTNSLWQRTLLPSCPQNLALNTCNPGGIGVLQIASGINLSEYPAPYLEFRHICTMRPGLDLGFVEYSLDGGDWTVFPESAMPFADSYTDEHPWFDANHSTAWSDWFNNPNCESAWAVSRFNLSQWGSCTNFRIRFKSEWGSITPPIEEYPFWALDYVKVSQDLPSLPVITYPHFMAMNIPTTCRITWTAQNATDYDVGLSCVQGGYYSVNVTTNYCYVTLEPSGVYYLNLRANNQSGSSDWTSVFYSFIVNDYPTIQPEVDWCYITNFQIGDYQRSSGWDAYIFIQDSQIQVRQGEQVPVSLSAVFNSTMPVVYKLVIDHNQNHLFDQEEIRLLHPQDDGVYTGTISIPADCPTGVTRLRVGPTGEVVMGNFELEDYVIEILPAPSVHVGSNQVSFEPVLSGYPSSEMELVITNPGSAPLIIESLEFGGADAEYFELATELSFPVTVNQSPLTLSLLYHPQLVGTHSANLNISSNAINTPAPIALSGSAVAPNLLGAIKLNGYSQHVQFLSGIESIVIPALSIEAWIKWDDESSVQCLISKGIGQMEVYTTSMSGIRFIPTPGVELISYYGVLNYGEWSHIVCVYDPSTSFAKIYVDGVDKTWQNTGSNPLSEPIIDNGQAWQIGRNSTGEDYFNGSIADLRVWDTARSLEDIRNNMHLNQDFGIPSLLANWRFDEPFGDKVYDSVQDQHGTLINYQAQERFEGLVAIGEGSASTQYPEAGVTALTFADCGFQLSDLSLSTPAVVTVTRLSSAPTRNTLQENRWILRHYNTLTGTATFSFYLEDDLEAEHLPEENFLMLTRGINDIRWYPEHRADSVNLNLDTVSFQNASTYPWEFQILWEPMQAPSNLQIVKHGSGLRLSWTAAPYTQGYRIYSSEDPEGPFDTIAADIVYGLFWNTTASVSHKFFKVVSVVD